MTEKLFTKNFTLLVLGQVTSLFGNFILKLALSMYVLEVTGSATIFAGILSQADFDPTKPNPRNISKIAGGIEQYLRYKQKEEKKND